ncbi:MAG: LemA family protein [Alphaproteobacteria bacterium]|nr:MAG: LemA family protein [Alphaproteobacteria bacterium]
MANLIFLVIVGLIALWVVSTYNALVKNRNLVKEGWSGIETQLKRRANLIPNLVETVKGYATHEKATLEEVTAMRTRAMGSESIAERSVAEGALTQALGRLFAVAEAYPDLKANENFQSLQQDLSEIEDQIQMARRYYNATVRDNNVKIESFPSNLIAKQFKFAAADYFEIEDDGDRAVPEVKF